jgi:hypothetical protein
MLFFFFSTLNYMIIVFFTSQSFTNLKRIFHNTSFHLPPFRAANETKDAADWRLVVRNLRGFEFGACVSLLDWEFDGFDFDLKLDCKFVEENS